MWPRARYLRCYAGSLCPTNLTASGGSCRIRGGMKGQEEEVKCLLILVESKVAKLWLQRCYNVTIKQSLLFCDTLFSTKFCQIVAIQIHYARFLNSYNHGYFLKFRYVKSRSDEQLRDPKEENSTSACKPEDIANNRAIVPCGLIAWSLFNDTYRFSVNNKNLSVNKRGISWKSDREHKFGKDVFPKNFQSSPMIGGAHLNESIPVSTHMMSCFDELVSIFMYTYL